MRKNWWDIMIDYSLYLCTDSDINSDYSLEVCVEKALIGGATIVQVREKAKSTKEFLDTAIRIKKITEKYHVPIIINDRLDIALAVDADGVHLGQTDMPIDIARKILGNDKIIGVTVTSLEEALAAEKAGADYLGVGAMFKSKTKQDAKVVEYNEFLKIKDNIKIPIVLIGGINKATIPMFNDKNVSGYAMIRPIIGQEDIVKSTAELKKLINSNRIGSH